MCAIFLGEHGTERMSSDLITTLISGHCLKTCLNTKRVSMIHLFFNINFYSNILLLCNLQIPGLRAFIESLSNSNATT